MTISTAEYTNEGQAEIRDIQIKYLFVVFN